MNDNVSHHNYGIRAKEKKITQVSTFGNIVVQ